MKNLIDVWRGFELVPHKC